MASGNSTPADFGATARRSWEDPSASAASNRSSAISSFERAAFERQAASSGGESSQRSDSVGRFAGSFHHRCDASEADDSQYYHDDEDDGEDDEEDDDHVRQSWTTEKEPTEERFVASFRFRENGRAVYEEEEEEEEEDDDGDSDASFGSLEWVTRQLRELERRKEASEGDRSERKDEKKDEEEEEEEDEEEGEDGHEEDNVESSVREALSLLNGGGASGHDDGEWERGAEDRRGSYFDIVQEAMATEWERGQYSVQQDQEEHQDEHDSGHHDQETHDEAFEDEWLEAFTAKGRVYYYNRRTRESSWTKPVTFDPQRSSVTDNHYETTREDSHEKSQDEEIEPFSHHREHDQIEIPEDNQSESRNHDQNHSSTSSTASSEHQPETTSAPANTPSNVLFCCFCGSELGGATGFQSHMSTCKTLQFHKESASPLYTQFQQMLVLLSEDVSLRALHYASSFPDAKPHPQGSVSVEQSVRESLTLLRVKHRSTRKPLVHKFKEETRSPASHPAQRLSLSSNASSKKREAATSREPLGSRYTSMKQKPTPVAQLNMETCRHCGRSFAEGRLAKHEAVCPRVFGTETAWGRGPSSSAPKNQVSESEQQRHDLLRSLKKKHHANLKHTLALSFQEHQASLVECPCCRRKFAPSGAQQHIDICKTVQHRPRNPVPLLKDFALAG